jgi:hypothetical protein
MKKFLTGGRFLADFIMLKSEMPEAKYPSFCHGQGGIYSVRLEFEGGSNYEWQLP